MYKLPDGRCHVATAAWRTLLIDQRSMSAPCRSDSLAPCAAIFAQAIGQISLNDGAKWPTDASL
jgi:hypothetical protein